MMECPICNTNYDSEKTNFCVTCGWDLTPYPLTFGGIPDAYLAKERTKIQWAKQNWLKFQQLENLNVQEKAHYTQQIQEQKTQLQIQSESLERERSDRQEQIDLLQRRLAQVSSDRDDTKSTLEQLQIQAESLERERDDRQEQIDLLQRRLAQVSSDRDEAKSRLEQIESEGLPQAKQEAQQLRQKIQQIEEQLYKAERVKKLLQERDRTAKTALSWLFNNLAERFAEELASINNRGEAIAKIQDLHSKRLSQDWADQPHRLEFIKTLPTLLGFSYEKQLDKIKESLQQLGDNDPIIGADALLSVRAELKYQGIVKRDADGDLPYSV
jgi:chromosome segregation ATPase